MTTDDRPDQPPAPTEADPPVRGRTTGTSAPAPDPAGRTSESPAGAEDASAAAADETRTNPPGNSGPSVPGGRTTAPGETGPQPDTEPATAGTEAETVAEAAGSEAGAAPGTKAVAAGSDEAPAGPPGAGAFPGRGAAPEAAPGPETAEGSSESHAQVGPSAEETDGDAAASVGDGAGAAPGRGGEPGVSPGSATDSAMHDVVEVGGGSGGRERGGSEVPRRGSRVLIGSVVAAVLVVGGGAYLGASALGEGGGGGAGAGGSGTPGVLALDGYAAGGAHGIAPGEPDPYGTVYRASGKLPGGPGDAAVYWARGEVTRGEVARLAEALGIDGTPVAEGQEWQVGSVRDGSGPSLQVSKAAPGVWTFNRYAPGTDGSATPTVAPVSESVAERAAAPVLKALGQSDAKVDASRTMGAGRIVNADPVVGGLPTYGWTIGVTVGAQGEVVGGSGQLKDPVRGDSYPVLSADRTLGLMNAAPRSDHRMGIGGCAGPVPLKDRLEAPCGTGGTASTTTARSSAVVEDAVFGLAAYSSGGRQVLVPSWLFEVRQPGARDTSTVAHPAVDPRYLASSAASGSPSPRPTGSPTTRDIAADGYWAEGKELTVSFTGGVCASYKVTATEDSGQVKVTVTETTKPGTVCIMIAKFYQRTVRLDRPLGDRKVVGSDGVAIPPSRPGARVPAPSSSLAR